MKLFLFVDDSWTDTTSLHDVLSQVSPDLVCVPTQHILTRLPKSSWSVRLSGVTSEGLGLCFEGQSSHESIRWQAICVKRAVPCEVVRPAGAPVIPVELRDIRTDLAAVRTVMRAVYVAVPELQQDVARAGECLNRARSEPSKRHVVALWSALETFALAHPRLAPWLTRPLAILGAWSEKL